MTRCASGWRVDDEVRKEEQMDPEQAMAECCRQAYAQGWRHALEVWHRLRFEHDLSGGRAYSIARDFARLELGGAPPGASVPDVYAWSEARAIDARLRRERD
jgi:hypothetical protein